MAENRTDALALAREYMANAVRTYKEAGHDPAAKSYYFRVWSFSVDDEVKLRQSMGGASPSDDGPLLIHRSDLDDRGIAYKTDRFKVGDVAALAAWITEQQQLGRAWTVPVWCERKADERAISTHDPSKGAGVIEDGDDGRRPLLADDAGKEISVKMPAVGMAGDE